MNRLKALPAFLTLALLTACAEGHLKVENKSTNSHQAVVIDGTNYLDLRPGESQTIDLDPDTYVLEFRGINGGGCGETKVRIKSGQTESRYCTN